MDIQKKMEIVKAKAAADGTHISGDTLDRGYYYGENPYIDTLIENALFCDMFPEEVANPSNFFGFCRSDYNISRPVC